MLISMADIPHLGPSFFGPSKDMQALQQSVAELDKKLAFITAEHVDLLQKHGVVVEKLKRVQERTNRLYDFIWPPPREIDGTRTVPENVPHKIKRFDQSLADIVISEHHMQEMDANYYRCKRSVDAVEQKFASFRKDLEAIPELQRDVSDLQRNMQTHSQPLYSKPS